jgi:predicted enzyme related to lactoylglutathione lyase
MATPMIKGLRTVIYPVADLAAGKAWYARVLERAPYFDEPFYVGFSVGGFELGLVPDGTPGAGGAQAYWGVADAAAALARLHELGGGAHAAVTEVGGGIKVAGVTDPFGNVFWVIENPHFDPAQVG